MRFRIIRFSRYVIPLALAYAIVPCVAHAQWAAQVSPVDVELRGLSVVSPQVVWASGQRGTVLHTSDAGAHWTRAGADLPSIRAVRLV